MTQLSLDLAKRLGERGRLRAQVRAEHAMPNFTRLACDYMYACLVGSVPHSGEELVDRCKAAGIVPPDDRAFGAAFQLLMRRGARVVGTCQRRKGHGSAGGKMYALL